MSTRNAPAALVWIAFWLLRDRYYEDTDDAYVAGSIVQVAAQMGNQGHSEANYFQFKGWTEAGIIKNVTKITAFMNSKPRDRFVSAVMNGVGEPGAM